MEEIDLFDKHRLPLNQKAIRGVERNKELYQQIVHLLIFTPDGRLLIQKRQDSKKLWPNLWDVSTSGVPVAGETSQEGMSREVFEELGLAIDFTDRRPAMTVNIDLGFSDYYTVEMAIDLDQLVLSKREISEVKLVSLDQVKNLIRQNSFVPYVSQLIPLLFELHLNGGEIKNQ